ncbi:MAG TPA: S8 family serine peptidase, partial [Pirellulales bacterium]|nr:S8 family serine peptidase [Pirellulales bacterium]
MLVADAAVAVPDYVIVGQADGAAPDATSAPSGMTPTEMRDAYGVNLITFAGGTIVGDGTGETIAIVDAYDDPAFVNSTSANFGTSDLAMFDAYFGLPNPPSFTKVNQTGGTALPGTDPAGAGNPNGNWEVEEALDVEWAHAMAPGASIVLVEATSASNANLDVAIQTAASLSGVVVVSMSFGSIESPILHETTRDTSDFATASTTGGITFVASTGDKGNPGGYPAFSPDVVAVGGTTLNLDASGNYVSETGWSGSGGGISKYESQPSYQSGVVSQFSTTKRTTPDISLDADPYTGASVYDSYNNSPSDPWEQIGGTSLAAPMMSALIAVIDQGRAVNGLSSLSGRTQTLPLLYSLSANDFHDITSGSNGSGSNAGPGYDLVTGRGSPVANLLVADMSMAFTVTSVTPAAGAVVTTPPADFTAQFDESIDSSTVQASDLKVNGIVASSFTLDASTDSITFHFNASPVTSAGTQTIAIAAGAIDRLGSDDPVTAFTSTFTYDTGPTVLEVAVSGSTWDPSYLAYLDSLGLWTPAVPDLGYALGVAGLQTNTVP